MGVSVPETILRHANASDVRGSIVELTQAFRILPVGWITRKPLSEMSFVCNGINNLEMSVCVCRNPSDSPGLLDYSV